MALSLNPEKAASPLGLRWAILVAPLRDIHIESTPALPLELSLGGVCMGVILHHGRAYQLVN